MANLFRCGGKPLITKTRDISFTHTMNAEAQNWYSAAGTVVFDFAEKLIGIKKVEIISGYGSYYSAGGATPNETNQNVSVSWVYALNQTNGCTIRVTAVGY